MHSVETKNWINATSDDAVSVKNCEKPQKPSKGEEKHSPSGHGLIARFPEFAGKGGEKYPLDMTRMTHLHRYAMEVYRSTMPALQVPPQRGA
jgi:hypothetical protein